MTETKCAFIWCDAPIKRGWVLPIAEWHFCRDHFAKVSGWLDDSTYAEVIERIGRMNAVHANRIKRELAG